jgi:tRNA threonylcarbamoyladenosine biosynthesis protein TsaB
MQKSQLTSNLFLAIQNTYDAIELALFEQNGLIDSTSESKMHASKNFILCVQQLFNRNNITVDNIQFMAVNQGPGPFTTLRTILASTNGLSFAKKIPMIGIDGLLALVHEYKNEAYPNTVALLNAFNKEVYFAKSMANNPIETGYMNATEFIKKLHKDYPNTSIQFIGNGVALHFDEIIQTFGDKAYIPDPIPLVCSIKQIGSIGWQHWQQQINISYQLLPLYLKKHAAQQALEQSQK